MRKPDTDADRVCLRGELEKRVRENLRRKKQGEKVNLEMKKYKNKIPKIRKREREKERKKKKSMPMRVLFFAKVYFGRKTSARNTLVACGCVYYCNSLNNSRPDIDTLM